MTTPTLTLTDFLLARIAEDEEVVQHAIATDAAPSGWLGPMQSDLDAHRTLVREAQDYRPELEHGDNGEWAFDFMLKTLAQPYADHEDFRDGWRVEA